MKKITAGLIIFTLLLLIPSCAGKSNQFPMGQFRHEFVKELTFEINQDGTWKYYIGHHVVSSGKYFISENTFVVQTDNLKDTIDPNLATYEWSYHNGILTLKLIGDGNPSERFFNLEHYPLAKYQSQWSFQDI
jgi:hypothetical protein